MCEETFQEFAERVRSEGVPSRQGHLLEVAEWAWRSARTGPGVRVGGARVVMVSPLPHLVAAAELILAADAMTSHQAGEPAKCLP